MNQCISSQEELDELILSKFTGKIHCEYSSIKLDILIKMDKALVAVPEKSEIYLKEGNIHRENGPALKGKYNADPTIEYSWFLIDGKFRNELTSPSFLREFKHYKESNFYNEKGELHCTFGPAVVVSDNQFYTKEEHFYYINSKHLFEYEWKEEVRKIEIEKQRLDLKKKIEKL